MSWKVKQISKVSKGIILRSIDPSKGSTIYVKASQDGTLFNLRWKKDILAEALG